MAHNWYAIQTHSGSELTIKNALEKLSKDLEDGRIEQVGSPLELYHTPKKKFVAGFIGSPKMNLIEGIEAKKLNASTIGIRPEHIKMSKTEGLWKGTVGVAEHLGSDTFIHIHNTGLLEMMTVRISGDVQVKHGEAIYLTPEKNKIHCFDAVGDRIL